MVVYIFEELWQYTLNKCCIVMAYLGDKHFNQHEQNSSSGFRKYSHLLGDRNCGTLSRSGWDAEKIGQNDLIRLARMQYTHAT